MKRKVSYEWRLREVMAQHEIFTATDVMPLLRDRGIDLSASQVHRLVSGTPERLSLQVLSAFCDILGCTPADLITTNAQNAGEPLQPSTLSTLVQALGVPSIAARTAAIRQHVLDLPAPIVATALGYHQVTTARLAAEAGTTWANYAPLRAP